MEEDGFEKEIVAQVVGHRSLKVTGGLRVELDIPDALPEDICYMTLLSVGKEFVKLRISSYEKPERKRGKREYKT